MIWGALENVLVIIVVKRPTDMMSIRMFNVFSANSGRDDAFCEWNRRSVLFV